MEPYQILLIVLGGLILLYTILAFLAGRFFLKQAFHPVAYTFEEVRKKQSAEYSVDYSQYDNEWNKDQFEIDGTQGKLRGEVIINPNATTPAKVAIVVHGHTQNRMITIKYVKIFYDLGFNVVIYDHPYFGSSDGKYTTVGGLEARDLTLVVDYAKQRFGHDSFVALHGESMGAVTVLRVLELRNDINLVVADCPYSSAMSFYREKCRQVVKIFPSFPIVDFANLISTVKYKCNFNKIDNVKVVQKTQVPICFIHGTADPLINYYHSKRLYKAVQNPLSELHLIEGALHARSHLHDPQRYTQIVNDFVNKIENNVLHKN